VVQDSPEVSPGAANPPGSVQTLLPFSGALLAGPDVVLQWYPVPGAASYRAQLASDAAFATIVSEQVTSASEAVMSSVAPGDYFWRVQVVAADGSASAFSETSQLTVDPVLGTSGSPAPLAAAARPKKGKKKQKLASRVSLAAISGSLAVPALSQRKDTRLLLLESRNERGAHGWSVAHAVFDPGDPADNKNCSAAAVAMVNRFFGGQLSQDRIAYQVFRDRKPGPEEDLPYGGNGFSPAQLTTALSFALGAAPQQGTVTTATENLFWQLIQLEVDAGRPIVLAAVRANGRGHATVLFGYRDVQGRRLISQADPWAPGSASGRLQQLDLSRFIAGHASVLFWRLPAVQQPVSDEPEIAQDSDNDGIVDFDESRRFGTDPFDPDSDGDFIGDFIDVRASVFDTTYGYALTGASRDYDGDGAAMELDSDSDDDNCTDGQEDFSLNGIFEPALSETHNFWSADKRCRRWVGTTVFDIRYTTTPFTHIRATGRIEWVPRSLGLPGPPPPPAFGSSFVPQGHATLDSFSVLGCRFSANPNRVVVDDTAGQMDIDYLANPPQAGGGAGTAMITQLRNCQGQTFTEVIPLIVLFEGPVPLNAAEDEIKRLVRLTNQNSEVTIDMNYHLGPR
jgi:hypothetical protein